MGIRRREFLGLVGGAAAWPVAARAQRRNMPVVGYVYPAAPDQSQNLTTAFRQGLADLGFVEGRNVTIEYRFAGNDLSKIPELLGDLVGRRVTVIAVTGGEIGALAAKAATTTIPIVFEIGMDPIEIGLVGSFNRPGGNATGVSAMNLQLDGKRLGLLAEAAPNATRIGILVTSFIQPQNQSRLKHLPAIAAQVGRTIEFFTAGSSREVEQAFASIVEKRMEALYIVPSPVLDNFRVQIATAAARHSLLPP